MPKVKKVTKAQLRKRQAAELVAVGETALTDEITQLG